jgi:murein DD-endopeptidase MepM/ murein hydrolase activator NlpD
MNFLRDGFTLVLIPRRAAKVFRLHVSRNAFIGWGTAAALLIVFAGISLFRAVDLRLEMAGYSNLRNEYLRQQVEIKKVAIQVDRFKDQIDRMRELDYKLRMITDLEVERPRPTQFGIGGASDARGGEPLKDADLAKLDVLTLLDKDLTRLEKAAQFQEESFNNLKGFLADRKDLVERSPYRWPVRGFLSSTFGTRIDPFTGQQRTHEALDIVAPKGTQVRAPADGIVTFTGWDSTFGNMVVIDHGYGVITRYGHNDTVLVREGQRVKRGDPITTVGSTGRSTGSHLHYEIRINDVAINPLNLLIN